jgi:inosine-uridine nucleoside N-ribohydrolase
LLDVRAAGAETAAGRTPVIFDTDIGDDIDDTWALALLLKCPELDVKLVVTDMAKGDSRAKLAAKLLEVAGRTDIPIGVGHGNRDGEHAQLAWVGDYELDSYPGTVHDDGVQAIIETINASEQPVTILAVGPMPNIAEALRRDPGIAAKARFVGMQGAVRKGYGDSQEVIAEYNVKGDVAACQTAFAAPWDVTITPLDTCGVVVLRGDKFARVRDSDDPLLRALIENYDVWAEKAEWFAEAKGRKHQESSTLFDTVAVYLAVTDELCRIETLPIRVTDEGMTVVDRSAKPIRVATEWKDLAAFENWLVDRLTGPKPE